MDDSVRGRVVVLGLEAIVGVSSSNTILRKQSMEVLQRKEEEELSGKLNFLFTNDLTEKYKAIHYLYYKINQCKIS